MSDLIESALAKCPGWDNATFLPIDGGVTNKSWLVKQGERKAVLKVDAKPRGEPFNSRPEEARIQMRAAAHGLAAEVLHASETVLLTKYVEGTIWSAGCLDVDENLDQLAGALKRLHALPLTGRTFDAVGAARKYATNIQGGDTAKIEECLTKIEAMPLPHNLCCCHNDLVAANIIYMPDVRFLDWEYACDNDPFFDIATIVAHHELPSDRAMYLLNAYFDGDGERWQPQLARQTEFYDALYWLWRAAWSPAIA